MNINKSLRNNKNCAYEIMESGIKSLRKHGKINKITLKEIGVLVKVGLKGTTKQSNISTRLLALLFKSRFNNDKKDDDFLLNLKTAGLRHNSNKTIKEEFEYRYLLLSAMFWRFKYRHLFLYIGMWLFISIVVWYVLNILFDYFFWFLIIPIGVVFYLLEKNSHPTYRY